jgi:hypothetical protein
MSTRNSIGKVTGHAVQAGRIGDASAPDGEVSNSITEVSGNAVQAGTIDSITISSSGVRAGRGDQR